MVVVEAEVPAVVVDPPVLYDAFFSRLGGCLSPVDFWLNDFSCAIRSGFRWELAEAARSATASSAPAPQPSALNPMKPSLIPYLPAPGFSTLRAQGTSYQ